MTIDGALRLIFPRGTRGDSSWKEYPEWPPDLFAICAFLMEQSGSYAWLRSSDINNTFQIDTDQRTELCNLGNAWNRGEWYRKADSPKGSASRGRTDAALVALWSALYGLRKALVVEDTRAVEPPPWTIAAMYLLIVADQASRGIGFFPRAITRKQQQQTDESPYIQVLALQRFFFPAKSRRNSKVWRQPASLGWYADSHIVCVLPKTRTPALGCTIRSLTHHLALLPGRGELRAMWHVNPNVKDRPDVFNLVVLPFPYRIRGRNFRAPDESRQGWFDVEPSWLPRNGDRVDCEAVTRFVKSVVSLTEQEVGEVNGVLLPELALDARCYRAVREALAKRLPKLRFLIAGVRDARKGINRNMVKVTAFYPDARRAVRNRGLSYVEVSQSKHHRWRLDRDQIRRYSLGDALDPNRDWWENVDVHSRELNFFVFGAGSCFTTLICEDLARVDPGQRAIRAIGPNIVFALLMDGPQLLSRWPSRSATVLAEDPGSSVLTVTSLGLVERSGIALKSPSRCVALWKDAMAGVHEIDLPVGSHGLCLTLTAQYKTEITLDGRTDGGAASYWSLNGVVPLTLPRPPSWL